MKIALVKQDIYQDLYVCSNGSTPVAMLESSIMRVGPLGLFTLLNSDFLIVRKGIEPECAAFRKSYRPPESILQQLPSTPINQIKGGVFDYLKPRSERSHGDFAVSVDSIDWDIYDIVISINIAIPTRIVRGHPQVLWCYMMGEASRDSPYVEYGYDVRITQNIGGQVAGKLGPIDFPYTFLGRDCLEKIANDLGAAKSEKQGVFAEINMISERPVVAVPQLDFVRNLGHEVVIHNQDVIANLQNLANSKYFVKLGGRAIRGNSLIEAISAGTLVLMDPKDVVSAQLLPKSSWVRSESEIARRIIELDKDADMYSEILSEQRSRLQSFVVDSPIESLTNCLEYKRHGLSPERPSWARRLREIRRNYF